MGVCPCREQNTSIRLPVCEAFKPDAQYHFCDAIHDERNDLSRSAIWLWLSRLRCTNCTHVAAKSQHFNAHAHVLSTHDCILMWRESPDFLKIKLPIFSVASQEEVSVRRHWRIDNSDGSRNKFRAESFHGRLPDIRCCFAPLASLS